MHILHTDSIYKVLLEKIDTFEPKMSKRRREEREQRKQRDFVSSQSLLGTKWGPSPAQVMGTQQSRPAVCESTNPSKSIRV